MIRWLLIMALSCVCTLWADSLTEAHKAYQQGEAAQTIAEREIHFNQALKLYLENEKPHGKMYYNIGNCYYQLNQPGMAIWYYQKAEKLLPRDHKIEQNLAKAKEQVKAPFHKEYEIKKRLLFWQYFLSPQERSIAFIALSLITFILSSSYIWLKKKGLKYLTIAFCLMTFVMGTALSQFDLKEKTGIFIQPSLLRCDAGMQYKAVDQNLIPIGEIFKVLELSEDGSWVKVKVSQNKKGYVNSELVRLF